jgi:hypothetical protein
MESTDKKIKTDSQDTEPEVADTEDAAVEQKKVTDFPPTDIILEVEGIDLHLNKEVLINNSDVFKAMLDGEFREKYEQKIPLPEKKYEDFVKFLRTFYPPSCAPVTGKCRIINPYYILQNIFRSPELKAQVSFSDCQLSVVRHIVCL